MEERGRVERKEGMDGKGLGRREVEVNGGC